MPTANEKILADFIKNQTHLLRYADGLANELLAFLGKTDQPLNDTVVSWLSEMEDARDLSTRDGRSWQKGLEETVASLREPAWDELEATFTEQLKELAITEAQGAAHIIQGAIPVVLGLQTPPADKLHAIVKSQPLEGKVLKEWLAKAKRTDVDSIVTQAKAGIIQGQTPTQVARTIFGNRSKDFEDGVNTKKIRRDIQTLTRTITNGVQNEAKQALYEANADIFDEEQFVSTLDSRTTLICAVNDNKVFKRGEGPMPPLHFNCRSLRVPFINGERLGNRAFDPSTEKSLVKEYAEKNDLGDITSRSKLPRGTKGDFDKWARQRRRELIGQKPSTTSYADWLKGQSKEFQDEYLGPARAEMFRSGLLKMDKFVSSEGTPLTLAQLAEKTKPAPKTTNQKGKNKAHKGVIISRDIRNGNQLAAANKLEAERHVALTDGAKPIIASLSETNRAAIKAYVEDQEVYESLNAKLRNGEVLTPDLLAVKQNLDEALIKQETPIARLYRGDRSLPATPSEAKALIGKTLRNDGYTSTSLAPRTAAQFGGRYEEIGEGLLPGNAYPTTLLEFNTEGRPPRGLYVSANPDSKKNKAAYEEAKTNGVITNPFYETEYLIGSGKRYKIVGLREELVYNEELEFDETVLVYEAVFLD